MILPQKFFKKLKEFGPPRGVPRAPLRSATVIQNKKRTKSMCFRFALGVESVYEIISDTQPNLEILTDLGIIPRS